MKHLLTECGVLAVLLSVSVAGLAAERDQHDRMMGERQAVPSAEPERKLETVDDLKEAIRALRERVAALEALKPSFTGFMPNFSERFHVMHRAGDAGDWAVAAHEVDEMTRLVGVAKHIDPKAGPLMEGFMTGHLRSLRETIEHGDQRAFDKALRAATTSCNACHQATGSAITVTLDVAENLNMRHPHALGKSKVSKEHMH